MHFDPTEVFSPEGILAKYLPNYEFRNEQLRMADQISVAIEANRHAVVEAGTGVGKSLAYLIPIINATVGTSKRAVIATHTITLQEQLYKKDIPFLQEVLPVDFSVEVFKGRSNYLCLRRLTEMRDNKDQLGILNEVGHDFTEWVQTTHTGDKNEAPYVPSNVWSNICCEKETCTEELCAHFNDCFYWTLRHQLTEADIIVTNQAMLLADLRTEGKVLPKYEIVVIDEAHNLEDVATNSFSHELNREKFLAYHRTGVSLQTSLKEHVQPEVIQEIRARLDQLTIEASRYFESLFPLIKGYATPIDAANRNDFAQTSILTQLQAMQELLSECELEEGEAATLLSQFVDFTTLLYDTMHLVIATDNPEFVYWAEFHNSEPVLVAAPIVVDESLRANLFAEIPTAILTSATMSTNNSCTYIRKRLGIDDADELVLGSPFDYSKQAILCVPQQAQNPRHPNYPKYAAYIILHTAALMRGNVLALFTSYKLMEEVADLIEPKLAEVDYSLFMQGDGARLGLIEQFRSTPQSILFGTNSFWEGVDIPGDALKAVVITRLPFAVPDRPVTAARLQAITDAGGNAFMEYSIPQAILRLKQGFGRLIRTCHDKGSVVIADDRILTAKYGAQFINSLPPARFTREINDLSSFTD